MRFLLTAFCIAFVCMCAGSSDYKTQHHGPIDSHAAIRSFDADYKWFDSLDFDAVRTGQFAKYHRLGIVLPPSKTPSYGYGFMVRDRPDVFLEIYPSLHFSRLGPEFGDHGSLIPASLAGFAKEDLGRKTPIMFDHLVCFLIARACDARGYTSFAKRYLRLIVHRPWMAIYQDPKTHGFSYGDDDVAGVAQLYPHLKLVFHGLRDEVAKTQIDEFLRRLGEPDVPWTQHLAEAERIERLFGTTRPGSAAKEYVSSLRLTVMSKGPHGSSIEDLIAQLPNENAQQISHPDSPQVLGPLGTAADSPAHKLARMGKRAVGPLINALNDHRLTRSVGGWMGVDYVLRVSDLAQQILENIAGHPLGPELVLLDPVKARERMGAVKAWLGER